MFGWLGSTDLRASQGVEAAGNGPLGTTLVNRNFGRIVILVSQAFQDQCRVYKNWLNTLCRGRVDIEMVETGLTDPTDYKNIYTMAMENVSLTLASFEPRPPVFFQISSGTPNMAICWILINQVINGHLIQSSRTGRISDVDFPFDISARMIVKKGRGQESKAFIYACEKMKELVRRVGIAAPLSQPVLIEGESGTGKEGLAQMLHEKGKYPAKKTFIAINCGAIPENLVESELFGHVKGAFTGAENRDGKIQLAHKGTLFLDEIGELPLDAQTKLLRVLQTREVLKIGDHPKNTQKVNFRLVAATNRNLLKQVAKGKFREDLYYRIAVIYLVSPSLRQRGDEDIKLLVQHYLKEINTEFKAIPGYCEKKIAPEALSLMCSHDWPGNIRELSNVLYRAAIWDPISSFISGTDLREAVLPCEQIKGKESSILNRLENREKVDLNAILDEVRQHYVTQALHKAGSATGAEHLLGLKRNNLKPLLKRLNLGPDGV